MENKPKDIAELEERIEALKKKNENKERTRKPSEVSEMASGLRVGIELASGTIVGTGIGYMLDKLFDFQFIMLLIFTILGFFAGMLNAYRYAKNNEKENN